MKLNIFSLVEKMQFQMDGLLWNCDSENNLVITPESSIQFWHYLIYPNGSFQVDSSRGRLFRYLDNGHWKFTFNESDSRFPVAFYRLHQKYYMSNPGYPHNKIAVCIQNNVLLAPTYGTICYHNLIEMVDNSEKEDNNLKKSFHFDFFDLISNACSPSLLELYQKMYPESWDPLIIQEVNGIPETLLSIALQRQIPWLIKLLLPVSDLHFSNNKTSCLTLFLQLDFTKKMWNSFKPYLYKFSTEDFLYQNFSGDTPLMVAVQYQKDSVLRELINLAVAIPSLSLQNKEGNDLFFRCASVPFMGGILCQNILCHTPATLTHLFLTCRFKLKGPDDKLFRQDIFSLIDRKNLNFSFMNQALGWSIYHQMDLIAIALLSRGCSYLPDSVIPLNYPSYIKIMSCYLKLIFTNSSGNFHRLFFIVDCLNFIATF